MLKFYKRLSLELMGFLADRTKKGFASLEPELRTARVGCLLKPWLAMMYLSVILAYIGSLVSVLLLNAYFPMDFITLLYYAVFAPILVSSFVFLFFYLYPVQRGKGIRKSIDSNLPFALIHMDAIASSGIPPEFMFELLAGLREYGEISRECTLVVRNIKAFGMSSISAVKNVADGTPSANFKEVLTGIVSTIEKGGNLSGYIKEMAEKALFDYRIKRDEFSKTLSTYADIYTALLITAPLMLLAFLVMLNIIGGDVFGFAIPEVISFITWVLVPGMNMGFLAYIHYSHPNV